MNEKSSTYKIALLRILARIADTANRSALHEADYVSIPLGIVKLFLLRMYKPLIENALQQMPATRKVLSGHLLYRPAPVDPTIVQLTGENT